MELKKDEDGCDDNGITFATQTIYCCILFLASFLSLSLFIPPCDGQVVYYYTPSNTPPESLSDLLFKALKPRGLSRRRRRCGRRGRVRGSSLFHRLSN